MAYSIRIVQNKNKKEYDKSELKEVQKIKAENQRLRKENKRLRKELTKYFNYEPLEEITALVEENKPKCPECKSYNLTDLKLGIKVIQVCRKCKWRKII